MSDTMTDEQQANGVVEGTATELAPYQPPSPPTLFGTDDPSEVIVRATNVASALKDVLSSQGLTSTIQGSEHVRVEGWQLLGSMLGVTAVCVGTEPVDGGYLATVEARACDGRVLGRADALCTKHEKRGPWKSADDYARLSMAQTRATSKALKGPLGFVVSLAGYQTTPAEEMTFAVPDTPVSKPQPQPKPNTITDAERDALCERFRATGLDAKKLKLKLTSLGVAGRSAKQGIGLLSPDQAVYLDAWLGDFERQPEKTEAPAAADGGEG